MWKQIRKVTKMSRRGCGKFTCILLLVLIYVIQLDFRICNICWLSDLPPYDIRYLPPCPSNYDAHEGSGLRVEDTKPSKEWGFHRSLGFKGVVDLNLTSYGLLTCYLTYLGLLVVQVKTVSWKQPRGKKITGIQSSRSPVSGLYTLQT